MSSFRESISAFGPHKHTIALSTASAAAIACAVFGSTMGQSPTAYGSAMGMSTLAAQHPAAAKVAKAATTPKPAPATHRAPATTAPAMRAEREVPEPRAAVTTAPAAPATTAPPPAAPAPVKANPYAGQSAYQIAQGIVPAGQFAAFSWIITHESGWDVTATNPSSGAYGLGQALPASKMAAYGSDYLTNPVTQIKWALAYMNGRYGSPNAAQAFWQSHGWY